MAQLGLLYPKDVKEEFGISRSSLHRLVKAGRIKPVIDPGRPGVARQYLPESIKAYLATKDPRGRKPKDGKKDES